MSDLPASPVEDIRGLTPVQTFVEGTLMLPLRFVERIEKYSDWLSAGAGATLIALVSRGELSATLGHYPQGIGFILIAASLLSGAFAKVLAYTAVVLGNAGWAGIGLATDLARAMPSREAFIGSLAAAQIETRPRLRMLQRPLVAFVRSRNPTDPLALATMVNASVQYLFTMVGVQLLSIVGGVWLLALPLFL